MKRRWQRKCKLTEASIFKDISIEYQNKRVKEKLINYFDIKTKQCIEKSSAVRRKTTNI